MNEYMKKYCEEHKEQLKENYKQWLEKNKDRRHQLNKEYYERNKGRKCQEQRERCKRIRYEVLCHYSSNPPECGCCHEKILDFLTIDHMNGYKNSADYGQTRAKTLTWNTKEKICLWLKRNNFPEGYQVLCFNCNSGRAKNHGICPHQSDSA